MVSIKNKQIPYKEITYEHPRIAQYIRANESKRYTLQTKKNLTGQQDELILDKGIEDATDEFDVIDVIEMDNQIHEYIKVPKVTKISRKTNQKREFEDENTKK